MSFNATKHPEGPRVSVDIVLANEAPTPVRYTEFEVEVLKMKVDLKPELKFSCRLDPWDVYDSSGVADWLLPASALNTGAFSRVHADEKERARQRMEEGALRAEFTDARIYLDLSISEADKKRYRDERAAQSRRNWEDSYRLCLSAGQPELPILQLQSLEVLWRCRDRQGRGHGNVSKLTIGKGEPFSDELAIGPSVFVFKEDQRIFASAAPIPYLGVVLDTELGLHTRSFPIDIHVEAGVRREFSLVLGATKSADVQVKFLMWREDGQWPEMYHMDLQFNCPIGTPAAVVDGEKLKEGRGEITMLHHLQELNLFRVSPTFPLMENDSR